MFTFEKYPERRLKLFFKYLVNASSKLEKVEQPKRKITWREEEFKKREKEHELRLSTLSKDRREELETKILMYYTKNKYLPYEQKLAKIRKKVTSMGRSKRYDKRKINALKRKVKKCGELLKKIKKLDIASHESTPTVGFSTL